MRVSIQGSDGTVLCQVNALHEGFAALGHEHVFDPMHPDAAFVFVGNPDFAPYLHLRGQKKLIFNVLDIPWHLPEVDSIVARLREQLPMADKVTAISATVARDVETHCGVKCETIYYPMKPVRHTGVRKYPQFRALLVGRLRDPNKRVAMAVQSLIRAGFNETEVAVVGGERIGWGVEMGCVTDEALNNLYNSVDYVLMLSKVEGIGLPAIEAACCGAIPIVAPDLTTFDEFWAESPLGLHYQQINSPNDVANLIRALEGNPTWKAEVKQDILGYAELAFRPKFTARAVAQRILDIHLSL